MENTSQIQILTPHEYPWWILIPGFLLALLIICTTPFFLLYELPEHRELTARIKSANALFEKADYPDAIELYTEILDDYPLYGQAKVQVAKSFFAMSESDSDLYEWGMHYLAGETIPHKEFDKIVAYVPEHYREDFLSNFKNVI